MARFGLMFDKLGVSGNAALVERYIKPVAVAKPMPTSLRAALSTAASADD